MRLSSFTIFWIVFYALAAIGLLAPARMAKWFGYAIAAPGAALTAVIALCMLIALPGTAWRLGAKLLKRWRAIKQG